MFRLLCVVERPEEIGILAHLFDSSALIWEWVLEQHVGCIYWISYLTAAVLHIHLSGFKLPGKYPALLGKAILQMILVVPQAHRLIKVLPGYWFLFFNIFQIETCHAVCALMFLQ